MRFISMLRLRARMLLGKLYNLAGIPGIVRECEYSSSACNARISVKAKPMYTIISVNGLDVYFHRLTGAIDGVGLSAAPNCTSDEVRQSTEIPGQFEFGHRKARNQSQ